MAGWLVFIIILAVIVFAAILGVVVFGLATQRRDRPHIFPRRRRRGARRPSQSRSV